MAFKNRIRLPFHITRPQFPAERRSFRLSNGKRKNTSTIISKTFEGEVDLLSEALHERLHVALSHDNVKIEGKYFPQTVLIDGDYEIEWNPFLNFPLAPAKFRVQATPYDFSNYNCQTCEEAMQLALSDDYITGIYDSLDEGETANYNVMANDSICCWPIVASIQTFNAAFVQSATINALTGVATIVLNPTTPDGTNVLLATYRVTCPNGQYDEANIYANVSGSISTCEAPPQVDAGTITETSAAPNWFWPAGAPVNVESFDYALYEESNLGTPIDSGNTTSFSKSYSDLNPGTCYVFSVRSRCDDDSVSEYVSVNFCTPVSASNCGRYSVFKYDPTAPSGAGPYIFQYINCSGAYMNDFIMNYQTKLICMLETSPGVPVFIENITTYTYVEPCT